MTSANAVRFDLIATLRADPRDSVRADRDSCTNGVEAGKTNGGGGASSWWFVTYLSASCPLNLGHCERGVRSSPFNIAALLLKNPAEPSGLISCVSDAGGGDIVLFVLFGETKIGIQSTRAIAISVYASRRSRGSTLQSPFANSRNRRGLLCGARSKHCGVFVTDLGLSVGFVPRTAVVSSKRDLGELSRSAPRRISRRCLASHSGQSAHPSFWIHCAIVARCRQRS